MAKMSDSAVPSLLLTETAAASIGTPAAGKARLFRDTDNLLYFKDEAGAVTAAGGAGAGVAADTIWDAAGDLAVGAGANTAAKLTLGASGTVPRSTGSALAYAYPPGHELDYVERTSNLTVNATTAAGADTWITGSSVAYDGSTRIKVEAFAPACTARQFLLVTLWDGSTDLGAIASWNGDNVTSIGPSVYGVRFLTPSNASHTYTLKAYRGATNALIAAASGGTAGQYLPAFIRITKA